MEMNSNFIWKLFRNRINRNNIARLTNMNPTIISSNCIGGVIMHDLNLQFLSPTINLFIPPTDYLKMVTDLHKYMSADAHLFESDPKPGISYPIGRLLDIEIHFMHYSTFELAKSKWIERSKRIEWNNIFLIMTDRDGCTYENMVQFDRLPYRKVIFTCRPYPEIKSSFVIKSSENANCVGVLSEKKNIFGKRFVDNFDYVSFLNGVDIN